MADGHGDNDTPVTPSAAHDVAVRREQEAEFDVFEGVRSGEGGPVLPVRLKPDDMFCFSCHRGVSCWNVCCHGTDITLTPYDILRLSKRLGLTAAEFLERHAYPTIWERAGLPVAKLGMSGAEGACTFLDDESGCTVYPDRPATCRYYPLGLGTAKMKDGEDKFDFHFLVKEAHCKGHDESKLQSVAAFRDEQGVTMYDIVNRGWMDIMMKMASWRSIGGPHGKDVSDRTKQMFYMVSTDNEALRRFVFETRFLATYYVDDAVVEELRTDDVALLQLGFDWMKNVLFNEPTISLREEVLQRGIAALRSETGGA